MKLKNSIKNAISVTGIALLILTQSFAQTQTICEVGIRNNVFKNANEAEYSGLAYHTERQLFIMPLDDPISGNIYFKGYNINVNASFNIYISNPGELTKDDLEGLTYLNDDYFVLLEEKENKIYFLEYIENSSGNPYFKILSGHKTGIPQATNNKDGLEGVSYDPHTNRLYLIREKAYVELYSIPITLPTPNFIGDIDEQQKSSVLLPINGDAAGLYHLGKIYPSGIAVADKNLFIASEEKGGGLSSYKINPSAEFCNTDNAQSVIEVFNPATCACESTEGCTDINACNFSESATIDDGSCLYQYSNCDDGNDNTINDRLNENCDCVGILACRCKK